MKKSIIIIITIILLSTLAILFLKEKEIVEKQESKTQKNHAVQIQAGLATIQSIKQIIENTATLTAIQKGDITSEVSSTITNMNIKNGDNVTSGDTLIIIDSQLFQYELDKSLGDFVKSTNEFISELKLSNSKKAEEWEKYLNDIQNVKQLLPLPNALSKSKLMSIVRFNLHTLYHQVKQSEKQVQNCVITAPFSGMISDIKVFLGAKVSSGTILFTLTDISRMNVEISILESDLSFIQTGTPFEFVNAPQIQYTISAIHPMIDPENRSGKAMATIHNPKYQFKDGQKMMVKLEKQVFKHRLVVPKEAVLTRNDRDLVFVVKNGIAKWQYVKLGVGNSEWVEIIEGIAQGDTVVTGGHYSLAHDVKVKVKME